MDSCHLCRKRDLLSLIDFGEHPIAHHFLTEPSEEEYIHRVDLRFCEDCGHFQLTNPIPPERLYTRYNWLSSWKPQPHVPRLVQLIEGLPALKPTSRIIEVGSNDGSFLEVLFKHGYRSVLGVEPAQDAQETARQKGVETVGACFNREVAHSLVSAYGKYDLFIARQVLEHIADLEEFREAMCILLRPGSYVLFEVPNFDFSLAASDYSAIWEEHVNYFTLQTLSRFLANAGIKIIHSETANFSGEALIALGEYVEGLLFPLEGAYLGKHRAQALGYRDLWPTFREALIGYLCSYRERGGKVAVYGAGCRACSLINFAGLGPHLEFVLDDQPEKQGKYMPGSRLSILPGSVLEERPVELCLLAVNAENEEKVLARHQAYEQMGGRFHSLHPPSSRLLPIWGHI